jgi:Na+/phosphate symporter
METTNLKSRIYLDRRKPTSILETTLSTYNLLLYIIGLLLILSVKLPWFNNLEIRKTLVIVGLGFIIFGLKITVDAIKSGNALEKFKKSSKVTAARVIDHYTAEEFVGGDGYGFGIGEDSCIVIHHIVVEFYATGRKYVVDAKVDKWLYEKAVKNHLLNISYLSSNPYILLFNGEI